MIPTPSIPCYLPETPSQTAGPYVHIGLIPEQAGFRIFENNFSADIAAADVAGQRIIIEGRIFDGAGHVTKDVLVETWQANAAGRYNHPAECRIRRSIGFRGWARLTDFVTGLYTIRTIKPGSVVGRKGRKAMAPHLNFWLASRGINIGLATRMYFGDEEAANSDDPVLNIIEQPERRKTLIAPRTERDGAVVYTFDIYLQGDRETVFFEFDVDCDDELMRQFKTTTGGRRYGDGRGNLASVRPGNTRTAVLGTGNCEVAARERFPMDNGIISSVTQRRLYIGYAPTADVRHILRDDRVAPRTVPTDEEGVISHHGCLCRHIFTGRMSCSSHTSGTAQDRHQSDQALRTGGGHADDHDRPLQELSGRHHGPVNSCLEQGVLMPRLLLAREMQ